mmetsp:Transcript_30455/g.90300  ORF Transcript_30455/g.90300 Transcript_30455/m.90300 type:complete len:224 (-) Transcript_30455:842-1513(-)
MPAAAATPSAPPAVTTSWREDALKKTLPCLSSLTSASNSSSSASARWDAARRSGAVRRGGDPSASSSPPPPHSPPAAATALFGTMPPLHDGQKQRSASVSPPTTAVVMGMLYTGMPGVGRDADGCTCHHDIGSITTGLAVGTMGAGAGRSVGSRSSAVLKRYRSRAITTTCTTTNARQTDSRITERPIALTTKNMTHRITRLKFMRYTEQQVLLRGVSLYGML